MNRSAGAKSKEFTHLIRFDQKMFKDLLEENLEDMEKFHYIKDSIKFYKTYDGLFTRCYSCNQTTHLIKDCPMLHRFFFKDIILNKWNYSENQKRIQWIRYSAKRKTRKIWKISSDRNPCDIINKIVQRQNENINQYSSEVSESEIDNESYGRISKNKSTETFHPSSLTLFIYAHVQC